MRFSLFILVGGLAALVNLGARVLLTLAMRYEAAVTVAYLFGMTVAYVLNKRYVFPKSGRAAHREYVRFAIVNGMAFVQVFVVSVVLARWAFPLLGFTFYPETVAHIIGVGSPVVTSFLGHKYYSFSPDART
jgi:putative flippase GtrA